MKDLFSVLGLIVIGASMLVTTAQIALITINKFTEREFKNYKRKVCA